MEVKQSMLFTFTFMAEGQGFSFGIQADNRKAATLELSTKLEMVLNELRRDLNSAKSTAAS